MLWGDIWKERQYVSPKSWFPLTRTQNVTMIFTEKNTRYCSEFTDKNTGCDSDITGKNTECDSDIHWQEYRVWQWYSVARIQGVTVIFTGKNTGCDSDIQWQEYRVWQWYSLARIQGVTVIFTDKKYRVSQPRRPHLNIPYRDNLNLTKIMMKMIQNGAAQISFFTLLET